MQIRSDILVVVGSLLVCLIIPSLVYHKVRFKPALTAQEKAVAEFSPAILTIARHVWQDSTISLPVAPPAAAVPMAVTPAGAAPAGRAPVVPKPALPRVSMILHDGSGSGTAIIDGTPVRVGGQFSGWRLERIEGNRVLLRGQRGTVWVSQE